MTKQSFFNLNVNHKSIILDKKRVEFILKPQKCSMQAQKVITEYRVKSRHLKDQIIQKIRRIQILHSQQKHRGIKICGKALSPQTMINKSQIKMFIKSADGNTHAFDDECKLTDVVVKNFWDEQKAALGKNIVFFEINNQDG